MKSKSVLRMAAIAATLALPLHSLAQSCAGGAYLNPRSIRGDSGTAAASSDLDVLNLAAKGGLSTQPFYPVRTVAELRSKPLAQPLCWIFANPTVGMAMDHVPLAVNMQPIDPAILVIGPRGNERDAAPIALAALPPKEQADIVARLKKSNCMGMESGVTTQLAKASGLCAAVEEVKPTRGLGQSYLPSAAAASWREDSWVGVVTRKASAMKVSSSGFVGAADVRNARLISVPVPLQSWGYGLYVHPTLGKTEAKKAAAAFEGLRDPSPAQAVSLDLDKDFAFRKPTEAEEKLMRELLAKGASKTL